MTNGNKIGTTSFCQKRLLKSNLLSIYLVLEIMNVKLALQRQTHAALAMLRECVELCPAETWTSGPHPRSFWRIAYHAAAYAHLYLFPNLDSFQPWSKHRQDCTYLEGEAPDVAPYTQAEILECIDLIDSEVEARLDALDLDAETCGFTWYPAVSRVELQILSLRHLHGHIGQLSEILIGKGIDTTWLGPAPQA